MRWIIFLTHSCPITRRGWDGSGRGFEFYKEVVRGAYRFHDMMLERLLQLAGPETTSSFVPIMASNRAQNGLVRRRANQPVPPCGTANLGF